MSGIERVIRYVLAGVFGFAGIMKILSPESTADIIVFFDLLTYSNAVIFVYFAAATEVVIAVLLMMRFRINRTALVAGFMCLLFVLISVLGWLNNWNLACGCFGRFSFGKFDGMMVIRNTVLLLLSAGMIYMNKRKQDYSKVPIQ